MAVATYSTEPMCPPAAVLADMSISALAALLDAIDAATDSLIGIFNRPSAQNEAAHVIEGWMDDLGHCRNAVLAELEARPAGDDNDRLRLRTLIGKRSFEDRRSLMVYLGKIDHDEHRVKFWTGDRKNINW